MHARLKIKIVSKAVALSKRIVTLILVMIRKSLLDVSTNQMRWFSMLIADSDVV